MKFTLGAVRGARPVHALAAAGIAAVAAVAIAAPSALANNHGHGNRAVPPPPANPTSADQIQNIDQVKTAIKAYYGDTATAATDPVTGSPTTLHFASPTSAYAAEMAKIEASAAKYLKHPGRNHDYPAPSHTKQKAQKAIVLDIDDTTLNTYNYEIYSNFVYSPTSNAAFVNTAAFPAVFGMPALVNQAVTEGYTIFFLTGRPVTQTAGTVTNLTSVGYPSVPADHLYLKDLTAPWLASCAPTCTTIQYKSLTRAHIESLGYDIVANFGDQFSDLSGGHADNTFKLPNPMYYLP